MLVNAFAPSYDLNTFHRQIFDLFFSSQAIFRRLILEHNLLYTLYLKDGYRFLAEVIFIKKRIISIENILEVTFYSTNLK